VQSINAKVISCFPAHPRRRRNETGPLTDRKAFWLFVDDANRDRLLDDSKWPDSVIISEWYHLDPKARRKPTVSENDVAGAAVCEADERSSQEHLPVVASAAAAAMDSDMVFNSHNDDTVLYQDGVAPTTVSV